MFAEALSAGENRDYQRAAELLTALVSETDEYPSAYLYLGRSYHALGKVERAIQFLRFFVEIKPNTGAGYFFLGRSFAAAGLFAEAKTCLQTADNLDPENAQILGLLGLMYLKTRQTERAVEVLAAAVEIEPENRELYTAYLNALVVEAIRQFNRGEFDLARQMLEFLIQQGMSTTVTRLYLAYSYRKLDRHTDALEQYDWILEREPNDHILLLHRAESLYQMGKVDRARSSMSTATGLRIDETEIPDAPTLHRLLATEAYERGALRRSIDFAKSVLKQIGSDFEMHMLVGEAYRRLSVFERADNHFNRAVKLEKRRIEPRHGLILVHWQQERFDEALSVCEAVLRMESGDETAAYYAALSRAKLHVPPAELIGEIEELIDKSGPDPYLFTCIADQYMALAAAPGGYKPVAAETPFVRNTRGDGNTKGYDDATQTAARYYRMAIDVSESHRPAYEGLLRLVDAEEKLESAAELYHAYFARFADDSDRRKRYIQILVTLGDFERAIEQIQLQLPIEGESEGIRRLQAFCYRQAAKFREAGILYRQLLKERPDSELYLRALAFCLEKSGNLDQSIRLMKRAFEYKSPSYAMRLIYGVLLFKGDFLDEAVDQFRGLLDEKNDDWRVHANIAEIYRKRGIEEMVEQFRERAESLRNDRVDRSSR